MRDSVDDRREIAESELIPVAPGAEQRARNRERSELVPA